jgi:hypothetical protein
MWLEFATMRERGASSGRVGCDGLMIERERSEVKAEDLGVWNEVRRCNSEL